MLIETTISLKDISKYLKENGFSSSKKLVFENFDGVWVKFYSIELLDNLKQEKVFKFLHDNNCLFIFSYNKEQNCHEIEIKVELNIYKNKEDY